jgi:hypothetical protein
MTKIVRNRLSVLAWTASIFCSVLLLISAIAAAEHKRDAAEISVTTTSDTAR